MLRSRRLPTLTAFAAAVTATAFLGGCSAGFDATSTRPYAPADGVIADSGDLKVLNALVVAADGADTGLVSMTVVNKGTKDDRVTGITSPSGTVTIDGDDQLPAGGALSFGTEGATATISPLDQSPGQGVELKITFSRAEPVTLRTVIVPATDEYSSLTPSP